MSANRKPVLLATVFSDYICPFCYIGDLRLARLREEFDLRINWMLVEIHPETPPEGAPVDALGYGRERWQGMQDNLQQLAAEEGVSLRQPGRIANSRKALQLAEAAKQAGADVFYRLHAGLFEAVFGDGRNIGDEAVLRDLARSCGLPPDWPDQVWSDTRVARCLQEHLVMAGQAGVRATPTVFFSARQRLDGALPYERYLAAARAGLAGQQLPAQRHS